MIENSTLPGACRILVANRVLAGEIEEAKAALKTLYCCRMRYALSHASVI
jgi:hypothetical protein